MNGSREQKTRRRQLWLMAALVAALAVGSPNLPLGEAQIARTVSASSVQGRRLIPGGKSLGIAIETEGLVVVGTSDLGVNASPARLAGLNSGDVITRVNDQPVRDAKDLAALLTAGETASLQVTRGDVEKTFALTPETDPRDGSARIGAWVRSSTAGVGTLTYVDPQTGEFGALGHAISDVDTGVTLPVAQGQIYHSRVAEIHPSRKGDPGEIVGDFLNESVPIGEVRGNGESGVFGDDYSGDLGELRYSDGLEIAARNEVHTGSAQILTTLDDEIETFECEIERVTPEGNGQTRDMVVRVTDAALLSRTGGIVQGMSGSPILQDGKLIGAVTHVLVNDPTRGYGIFIENMLDTAG